MAVVLILGMIAILVVTWSLPLTAPLPAAGGVGVGVGDTNLVVGATDDTLSDVSDRVRLRLRRLDMRKRRLHGKSLTAASSSVNETALDRLAVVDFQPLEGCDVVDDISGKESCSWPSFDAEQHAPSVVKLLAYIPTKCFQTRLLREATLDVFERALQSLAERRDRSSACIDFVRTAVGRTVIPELSEPMPTAYKNVHICRTGSSSDDNDDKAERPYVSTVNFNISVAGTPGSVELRLAYPDSVSLARSVGAVKATAALVVGVEHTKVAHRPAKISLTAQFQAKWLAASLIARSIEVLEEACSA